MQLEGVSATTLKHLRRTGGEVPVCGKEGRKITIAARLIREITPYFS